LFATFFGQTALVGGVTLIAPDVALASGRAGHLIDVNAAQGNAAGPITVNFDPNGDFTPANSIPVREYHVYPGNLFSGEPGGGNREGILDVTVLILDTASAPPAAFVPPPIPLPDVGLLDRLAASARSGDVVFLGTGWGAMAHFGRGSLVGFDPTPRSTAVLSF